MNILSPPGDQTIFGCGWSSFRTDDSERGAGTEVPHTMEPQAIHSKQAFLEGQVRCSATVILCLVYAQMPLENITTNVYIQQRDSVRVQ